MVRRAVSSRPPERPRRGGGANWVGPEGHPEPADWGSGTRASRSDSSVARCGRRCRRLRKFSNHAAPPPCELPSPTIPFLPHRSGSPRSDSCRRREWPGWPSRAGRAYWARSVSAERTSEVNPRPEAWGSTSLLVLTTPMTPCPEAGSKAMNERKPPWSPV